MRYIRNSGFILIAIYLLFASCKKKDETTYINPELKEHFSFKKGSYWVYEDTATGALDTFTVTETSEGISKTEPPNLPSSKEYHTDYINCSRSYSYWLQIQTRGNSVLVLFPNMNIGFGFGYPGLISPSAPETISYKNILFDSVVVSHSGYYSICYAKSGVGLVKIHLEKDTLVKTWMLREWKIAL